MQRSLSEDCRSLPPSSLSYLSHSSLGKKTKNKYIKRVTSTKGNENVFLAL